MSERNVAWSSAKIRSTFIEFFQQKYNHTFHKSSPVVPHDDPTLLFANAGMNQFKPCFLGQVDPSSPLAPLTRACNTQKCIRAGGKHNDLEDVGRDTYHHTFFEMLGNWSFGDYFKEEAISWAMELLIEVYGLNIDRIYATYYEGDAAAGIEPDNEAREIWLKFLPPERVLPFGAKENFWEMGDVGPCGPCSEIHYDRIGDRDCANLVNMDDPTVIEIWNLVFIQFNREADGSLRLLPNKLTETISYLLHIPHTRHVDTGMGFERITSILQNKMSNYDTDVFMPIFADIQQKTGCRTYDGKLGDEDVDGVDMAYRVVADHIRTLTFAIADGAVPSNEGRGYVLRRILRRAVRYGQVFLLGKDDLFFAALVHHVVEQFGDVFPELREKENFVYDTILDEEKTFGKTLSRGNERFKKSVPAWKERGDDLIPGDEIFFMYDTMGFPVDLIELMAKECNLKVDMDGYDKAMQHAKEISRSDRANRGGVGSKALVLEANETSQLEHSGVPNTDDSMKYTWFHEPTAVVKAIFTEDGFAASTDSVEGKFVGIVLDQTSFYAQAGGQVADVGQLVGKDTTFEVIDCRAFGRYKLHLGTTVKGVISVGNSVICCVDYERRKKIAANHTMTHMLNFALRKVLGSGIDQKGSELDDEKLRFDFSHGKPVTIKEATDVEKIVQERIEEELPVYSLVVSLAEARAINSLRAVFGEVYPDPVRVISVGTDVTQLVADPDNEAWNSLSVELCGGTHLSNTKEAEAFALVEETGKAKGIRRMVALTGEVATKSFKLAEELAKKMQRAGEADDAELQASITRLSQELDAATISIPLKAELSAKLTSLVDRLKKAAKEAAAKAQVAAIEEATKIAETAGAAGETFVVSELTLGADAKVASKVVGLMVEKMNGGSAMVVSFDSAKRKVLAVAACSKAHSSGPLAANAWVSAAVKEIGGKGGGKPILAQAQGPGDAAAASAVANAARDFASKALAS